MGENLSQNHTHENSETIKNNKLRAILADWQSKGRRFDPDQLHVVKLLIIMIKGLFFLKVDQIVVDYGNIPFLHLFPL